MSGKGKASKKGKNADKGNKHGSKKDWNAKDWNGKGGKSNKHKGKNDNIQAHRVLPSERQERRRYADKANAKYISK